MATLIVESIHFVVKARKNIAHATNRNEVHFISFISLLVYVLFILGIIGFEQRYNPAQEALLFIFKKVDSLVHLLVNN
jgi:hypothetical protein